MHFPKTSKLVLMEDVSAKLLPALFSLSLPAKSTIAIEIAGQMILKIA